MAQEKQRLEPTNQQTNQSNHKKKKNQLFPLH